MLRMDFQVGYGDVSPSTMFGKLVRFLHKTNRKTTIARFALEHHSSKYFIGWGDLCCGWGAGMHTIYVETP